MSLQPLCTTQLCSTPVLCVEAWSNYRALLCHNVMFSQFKMHPNIAVIVTALQSG